MLIDERAFNMINTVSSTSSQTAPTFDSIVMAFISRGFKVVTQLNDTYVFKKTVGVNGWIAIAVMLFFSLLGMVAVLVWIAVGGSSTFTVQRSSGDALAMVTNKQLTAKINAPYELENLFASISSGFKVGYGPAIGIGIVCFILNLVILRGL